MVGSWWHLNRLDTAESDLGEFFDSDDDAYQQKCTDKIRNNSEEVDKTKV